MDQVITFNKSYQTRMEEYSEVFSEYKTVTAKEIKKVWSNYLEMALDPNGWQAIWKIPRLTCETFKISFPTVVLVYIDYVDFAHLRASVKILAVQDDIHLPENHKVMLLHLWPTKEQDCSVALNINSTANSIDMLRFFYYNIFMPWDGDNEDAGDWVSEHLNYRLHLYYDMTSCSVSKPLTEYFTSLLTESRRLQLKREHMELKLRGDFESQNPDREEVQALAEINVQLLQIRNQIDMLENPLMRDVLLKQLETTKKFKRSSGVFWTVVSNEGNIDDYLNFFEKIRVQFSSRTVAIRTNIDDVLGERGDDDIIVLNKAQHLIGYTLTIKECVLKGIYGKNDTILTSLNEDIMLDLADEVLLENLKLEAASAQCGICVRSGRVTLKNCKIVGDGQSTIHQGIIVLEGSHLQLINCEISQFHVAIVGNSGSSITLTGCEIYDSNCGLKIFENCHVDATSCSLRNCKEYGIVVETENTSKTSQQKTGTFDILSVIPSLQVHNLIGKNNLRGDVLINARKKIEPFTDLFSREMGSTNDDDMESVSDDGIDFNNTVIERTVSPYTI